MSRFVSAGTDEDPVPRDEAWLKAQQEVEARRKPKQDPGRQDGGKSLYEVLEANKVAKQEAFEESIRLKNQFRALEDDEVEFLDSVLESTRAKEAAVKQEMAEQLETFRKQREEAEQALLDKSSAGDHISEEPSHPESWAAKKRKRKEKDAVSLKLRKVSSSEGTAQTSPPSPPQIQPASSFTKSQDHGTRLPPATSTSLATEKPSPEPASAGLGLGAYSSDDD